MADQSSSGQPIRILGNEALSGRKDRFMTKAEARRHSSVDDASWKGSAVLKMRSDSKNLAGKVALFNRRASEHVKCQQANPFSESWDHAREVLDRDDPRYGRPAEGSGTERRGRKAGEMITNEIRVLADIIYQYGDRSSEGIASITFGELFQIYTRISNKLVGMLMRARKHGLLTFEGEMLFQRRDDNVVITLLKPVAEIREMLGITRTHEEDYGPQDEDNHEVL